MSIHQCPVAACTVAVDAAYLMCRAHWQRVPKPLRDAVWATYADGSGVGSLAYLGAIRAAIEAADPR